MTDSCSSADGETHYYPFGLTMQGISSKAAGKLDSKTKFVGQELDDELGWNTYQFRFRTHDPQIGRFLQIDPLADRYVYNSTYAYAENDVINSIDLEGLERLPVRYMDRSQYAENRRSYREVNSYVPRPSSYRTSRTFIPNQQAGSASTPANIYEDFKPGTGDQHTGPFVMRGNSIGKLSVALTEGVDDVKGQIQRVTVTSDNIVSNDQYKTSFSIKIEWKSKEAENQFNSMQNAYDNKVSEIRNTNKLSAPPGPGATKEEWQSWASDSQKLIQKTNLEIAVLGPSPTQVILNSTLQTGEFKKIKTEIQSLPEVRPVRQ